MAIKGTVVVYNAIPALIAIVEAEARAAVKKTADAIVRDARGRAPRATGYLRNSISAKVISEGKESEIMVEAPYAAFVEYGTYKMAARPFLSPAVAAHADEFIDAVGKGAIHL